jgi:hypothetical protein
VSCSARVRRGCWGHRGSRRNRVSKVGDEKIRSQSSFETDDFAIKLELGTGFLILAIVSTALIMELSEDVGFGVGWGLPWVGSALFSIPMVLFIKSSMKWGRAEWRSKEVHSAGVSV